MNIQYIPKNFCKDYVELNGSNQLPMFMAVVQDIKPLMDDWIPFNKFKKFKKICEDYKLKVEPDWCFIKVNEKLINSAIDSDRLSTTKFYGTPYSNKTKKGNLHVFISKSEQQLKQAKKFGWYPLIVNQRSLHKPFIDHLRFGKVLGYPECCIRFFRDFNNHYTYNHPYETLKNTKKQPNFLCNNIFMDFTYSLIHHLPCSFSCNETTKIAKELLREIKKQEPLFAKKIKQYLKLPLLIFEEKNTYAFEGKIKNNKLYYKDHLFLGRPEDNILKNTLNNSNKLEVTDNKINFFKNNNLVHSIIKQKPENGFLLQFN
jgi:hypothetical protein